MYWCICVSAFLFSYHTHEQPRQSAGPAHSHASVLLWISSCLWSCWLHPWHAHIGFHGCRGETFFMCCGFCFAFDPSLGGILVHDGFAFNSRKKETLKTQTVPPLFSRSCRLACFLSLAINPEKILVWRREWEDRPVTWCWNQMTS